MIKIADFSQRPAPIIKRAETKQLQQQYSIAELKNE